MQYRPSLKLTRKPHVETGTQCYCGISGQVQGKVER